MTLAIRTSAQHDREAKEDDDDQAHDFQDGRGVFKPGEPFVWQEHQYGEKDHKYSDYVAYVSFTAKRSPTHQARSYR